MEGEWQDSSRQDELSLIVFIGVAGQVGGRGGRNMLNRVMSDCRNALRSGLMESPWLGILYSHSRGSV